MTESDRTASGATPAADEFEAIVIGTGFGGAVTACRLVEAGFKICVLERGRRYGPDDLPKFPTEDLFANDDETQQNFAPPPDFSRWLWGRDQGIYDVRDLDGAMSVQAAAYGGGSLIYANVHMRPPVGVFDDWPAAYRGGQLDPYFDLAAHMLRVTPIPQRLAKTVQLQRAAEQINGGNDASWFRTPLAVNFGDDNTVDFNQQRLNSFGREQKPCDMRGRCWRGCDQQAKNSLDLNYLARAEDGKVAPDIRTLAEVTRIRRIHGRFAVTYKDLLFRGEDEGQRIRNRSRITVHAKYVFLCAGSVNTTELLLKNPGLWGKEPRAAITGPLGSHYFPNSDSLGVVFDCEEPHEADYGPTITSALLYQTETKGDLSQALNFYDGDLVPGGTEELIVGSEIVGTTSNARATLAFEPVLDWGEWREKRSDETTPQHDKPPRMKAVGALVLADQVHGTFEEDETISIGTHATAKVRSVIKHTHWFLVEDGGYPSDLEALTGVFRSPLWLRRNRYLEHDRPRPSSPLRRPTKRLRLQAFADALGGTARSATTPQGALPQGFAGAAGKTFKSIFPEWFRTALEKDHTEFMQQASAVALPMLDRLLVELSNNLVKQIDADTLATFGGGNVNPVKAEVLARGLLRQGLQIIAGSEAAIATRAARLFLDPVPGTQGQLLDALGDLLLWALAYDTNEGHTGVLLTMGRDMYRGRLARSPGESGRPTLTAIVPSRLLDTSSAVHERMLRDIASRGWQGELRTNPAWTTLGRRVTVHSQGGCPMGRSGESVTNAEGEVHGCPSLYIMDAAAFPTSVGVNPSATIAAVAEFKIERFIRAHPTETSVNASNGTSDWTVARDTEKVEAQRWVDEQGRSELNPLNHRQFPHTSSEPLRTTLGLQFKERAGGFLHPVEAPFSFLWPLSQSGELRTLAELKVFLSHIAIFTEAEDAGVRAGGSIEIRLKATVSDLARLISPESTRQPMKVSLTGWITLESPKRESRVCPALKSSSFLQMFVRSSDQSDPSRFFHYELHYDDERGQSCTIHAWKVLRNAPGFDAWLDASTLFFEMFEGSTISHRGIMRVPVDTFLREQLPTMDITGTDDAARRSWALGAFYKYFIGELAAVYMMDAKKLQDLLWKLVTGIHV